MTVQPDATVLIQHKGSQVVKAQHVTWAEKTKEAPGGKWLMSTFKADFRDGQITPDGCHTRP